MAGGQERQEQRTGDFWTMYDCKERLFNPSVKSRDVDGDNSSSSLVSVAPACPLAIFTYANDIHLTTNDVTKGLIGSVRRGPVQQFAYNYRARRNGGMAEMAEMLRNVIPPVHNQAQPTRHMPNSTHK